MKEWFLRASISLKLTAFLLVISVVPLGLYLLVSYSVTRDTIVDLATQHSRQLLNNQRDYLELQMDQIVGLMSNLSGVAEVDQIMTAGDRQRQNAYDRLATFLATTPACVAWYHWIFSPWAGCTFTSETRSRIRKSTARQGTGCCATASVPDRRLPGMGLRKTSILGRTTARCWSPPRSSIARVPVA